MHSLYNSRDVSEWSSVFFLFFFFLRDVCVCGGGEGRGGGAGVKSSERYLEATPEVY